MDSLVLMDDGIVYNNWHDFVHEFRDGKIVQTRDYHGPRHVWTVLGHWAPWGATPVPHRSRPRRSNLQSIATTIKYETSAGPELERSRPFDPVMGSLIFRKGGMTRGDQGMNTAKMREKPPREQTQARHAALRGARARLYPPHT